MYCITILALLINHSSAEEQYAIADMTCKDDVDFNLLATNVTPLQGKAKMVKACRIGDHVMAVNKRADFESTDQKTRTLSETIQHYYLTFRTIKWMIDLSGWEETLRFCQNFVQEMVIINNKNAIGFVSPKADHIQLWFADNPLLKDKNFNIFTPGSEYKADKKLGQSPDPNIQVVMSTKKDNPSTLTYRSSIIDGYIMTDLNLDGSIDMFIEHLAQKNNNQTPPFKIYRSRKAIHSDPRIFRIDKEGCLWVDDHWEAAIDIDNDEKCLTRSPLNKFNEITTQKVKEIAQKLKAQHVNVKIIMEATSLNETETNEL